MRRLGHTLLLACLGLVLGTRGAYAEQRPPRRVGLHFADGWLSVSLSLRDLFRPDDPGRLTSGFVNRVVIHVEVVPEGTAKAIGRQDRHSEMLFDLWDERFRVRRTERTGKVDRDVATAEEAIEVATALQRFGVIELAALSPGATYRLRFRADLNPLSDDLVQDVRRWLVKTPGQGRSGTGDSVFGSFVSLFVNPRIEESERQITFWSQPFSIPAPTMQAGGKTP